MSDQRRVFELSPKEFRVLVRDAVFWGVLLAGFFGGLVVGLLSIFLMALGAR